MIFRENNERDKRYTINVKLHVVQVSTTITTDQTNLLLLHALPTRRRFGLLLTAGGLLDLSCCGSWDVTGAEGLH